MALEIARRLVGGIWRTGPVDEPNGGGGGSSQPIKIVRVPLAFDTPDLVVTGIDAYTPEAGEGISWPLSYLSITTPWDYTAEFPDDACLLNYTFSDAASAFNSSDLTQGPDQADGTSWTLQPAYVNFAALNLPQEAISRFPDTTPFRVVVQGSGGGDPLSTQGEGELVLFIIAAAP